ncbi:MAG TPA: hypothetical protein EYH32_02600 [Anaerolineae bacterium]|nr:hypothetical protein [Anaerolineae bacterium]
MSFVSEKVDRREFFVLSGETTVREAIATLKERFGRPPRSPGDEWSFDYTCLVVTLSEGKYALLESSTDGEFQRRLNDAADKIGEAILDMPLARVPDLCQPCVALEMTDDEAAVRAKCGGGLPALAVVLEANQPVGVFVSSRVTRPRGAFESRFPTQLFGAARVFPRDEPDGEKRQCPVCHATFGYYKPVPVGETWQYHCPRCDADLTAEFS